MKDLKPVFSWAKANGDANIYDRILMKLMPQLLAKNIKLTSSDIESSNVIEVEDEVYRLVLDKAEELIGGKYV